eukprot:12164876-Ditylum_brightwellii.AAC.1
MWNALDNKSRKLAFCGKTFDLAMLKGIAEMIEGNDFDGGCALCCYKFGSEHFIPSQTMIKMVKDFCTGVGNDGCISDFDPMVEIFEE